MALQFVSTKYGPFKVGYSEKSSSKKSKDLQVRASENTPDSPLVLFLSSFDSFIADGLPKTTFSQNYPFILVKLDKKYKISYIR